MDDRVLQAKTFNPGNFRAAPPDYTNFSTGNPYSVGSLYPGFNDAAKANDTVPGVCL